MKAPIKARGKGIWTFVVELPRDANGRRRQKRYTFHGTKGAAENERSRIVHEVTSGAYLDTRNITVGDYLDWWLESCIKPTVASRTYEGYAMIVERHLKPALGRTRLAKLNPMHVQQYETKALQEGRIGSKTALSKRTVLHHHRVLHVALGHAVKTGMAVRNPLDAVQPPRPERRAMQTLDATEVHKLFAAAEGTRLYAPLQISVATGMRRGELLGLHWRDVDLAAGTLAVRWSLQTVKGETEPVLKAPKSGHSRTVTLPQAAVAVLSAHRKNQAAEKLLHGKDYQDTDLVFCKEGGRPWKPNAFTGLWDRFKRKQGLSIRFHDLRHTYASLMLGEGVHPKVVQEALGHSTIAITMDLYSHVTPNLQGQAAEKLDTLLWGPETASS